MYASHFPLIALQYLLHTSDDGRYDDRGRGEKYGRRDHRDDRRGGRRDDRKDDRRDDRGPPSDNRQPQQAGNVPTGPRADRGAKDTAPSSSMPPPPVPTPAGGASVAGSSDSYAPPMTHDDLDAIRSRYLGVDKKKRKIRKMNDRKFVFDWDEQDDTGHDGSPLNGLATQNRAQVMFGRGHLAGMDDGGGSGRRPSLDKAGATAEASAGPMTEERIADPLERRRALKQGVDERHWTQKSLAEMKDRDWRIFREDFSISARGAFALPYLFIFSLSTQLPRWTNPSSSPVVARVGDS
jgi:ATP-dependent RNA helicase DDX23/PRP28